MLQYVDRRGTDCAKWDGLNETFGADGLMALWVADMDFRVDENIIDAVRKYLDTGVFGYYMVPDSYLDAFIEWERNEHGFEVSKEWIRFSPGVVSGFNMALQVLTEPGDAVIVNTPVYYPFSNAVKNNGRSLITSELVRTDGRYSVDFEDFEQKITDNDVKAFILCSPHNPVSRVWSAGELRRLLDICRRHDVAVISDEIHHDLVFGGYTHVPTLSIADEGDRIIMLTAASKTFNIAALQNSFVVIPDDKLREKWDSFTGGLRLTNGSSPGYIAVEAAYRHSKPWLQEVRDVIFANFEYIRDTFAEEIPEAVVTPLEGTYLAWVDFGAYLNEEELQPFMQDKCRLAFDYGSWFGGETGGTCVRINLATSRENIEEMTSRIVRGIREI